VNRRLIEEFGRGPRIRIVTWLKRSRGLSVRELAERLRMSYMGVKQHCVELHAAGYLETWRRPRAEGRPLGRPEMVYRPTPKVQELFPAASNPLMLELLREAQALFGPSAAEKLLLAVFRRRAADLRARVTGETAEKRARWLCLQREKEGYLSDVVSIEGRLVIEEHHSPLQDLVERYPVMAKFEEDLFSEVLGVPVRREQTVLGGLYCCRFLTREAFVPKDTLF
jgi:predicted ArsR family transcriptional regulator